MSQSINLANAYGVKKNGVDVHNVLLNGTKIWTAEYTLTTEFIDDTIKLRAFKWGYGHNTVPLVTTNPANWGSYDGPSVGGATLGKLSRNISIFNDIAVSFDGDYRSGAPFKSLIIDGVVLIPTMRFGAPEDSDNGAYMNFQPADATNGAFLVARTIWVWNSADAVVETDFPNFVPYAGLTKTNAIPETAGSSHKVVFTY